MATEYHLYTMKLSSAVFIILAAALTLHRSNGRPLSVKNSDMKRSEQSNLTIASVNNTVELFSFDPTNPCADLSCEGVDDSFCIVVTKCGKLLPVFLDSLGRVAACKNIQPLDVKNITSPVVCLTDPCSSASCPLYPEAVCFVTECSCKSMWLLPSGVEVNCFPVNKRDTRRDSGSRCDL